MSDYPAGRLWCALLALALCGGCTVMSESECVNADWREVGRNDGLEGKRAQELVRYQDACLQYGVTPDGDAYAQGREEGLTFYCTPETGYWEGRNGGGYRQVCPPSTARDFLEAYRAGQGVLNAIDTARSIEADIDSAKDRIGYLNDEIKKLESPDDSKDGERPAGTVEERQKEIDRLEGELKALRAWRVVHFSAYVGAVDEARRLGFQEEYPPWPGWTP